MQVLKLCPAAVVCLEDSSSAASMVILSCELQCGLLVCSVRCALSVRTSMYGSLGAWCYVDNILFSVAYVYNQDIVTATREECCSMAV